MEKDLLWDSLFDSFKDYILNKDDQARIKKAYLFAREKHEGQFRRSGEAYINHPVEVAIILTELGTGPETLIAALLHDVVEDTDATFDDIEKMFNKDIRDLVDGVTKIGKLSFQQNVNLSDNHQKMLIAMANDIRVIIIKIADRLHNIRTLTHMPEERQKMIAQETLDIYAPLAHRLGIFRIKAELEDQSLKYTDPLRYYEVSKLIQAKKEERNKSIENIIINISDLFVKNSLQQYEIKGRIKNIYSIYKKMVLQHRAFEDIYDLLAIRIIVDKVEECYQALGLIHANFTPIPRRFKDYIAVPKPNLYQSLHTTVLSDDGTLFEVQIRTKEMDLVAEVGVAAHWAYKENKTYSKEKEQFEISQKLKWYGELLKMSKDQDEVSAGSFEFVESVKGDILTANVYVFTPKGEVIELPSGATPLDFAYRIHTDVGNKTVGATINNKIVPLDYKLKTGEVVSIKTNKNSVGPNESWLKIVKSNQAKHKIRGFLNKQNKDLLYESGKEQLNRDLVQNRLTSYKFENEFIKKHFEKNFVENLDDLYLEIGKGNISSKTVVAKILNLEQDRDYFIQRQIEKTSRHLESLSETGIVVPGLSNPKIKLSTCCLPIPGDRLIGYISKNSGIIVHSSECPNAKDLDEKRFIDVFFQDSLTRKFPTYIKVEASNKPSIISDIVQVINIQNIQIAEMNAITTPKLETLVRFKILVSNHIQLQTLFANISKIPDVYQVGRNFR